MSYSSSSGTLYALTLADSMVSISCPDEVGGEIVRFLFPSASPVEAGGITPPAYTIRELAPERLALYRGDGLIHLGPVRGHLAEVLAGEVTRDLVIGCSAGPVLHAGLVERAGLSLLLPGMSGAGKSTLTAWLCSRGWSYLTDELVCVAPDGSALIPLPRALSLKGDPRALLPELPWERLAPHIWPSVSGILIEARGLNPQVSTTSFAPAQVLFARYSPDGPTDIQPASVARRTSLLLQSLVNAPNLANAGLSAVIELAQRLTGFEAIYSHLSQLEPLPVGALGNNVSSDT